MAPASRGTLVLIALLFSGAVRPANAMPKSPTTHRAPDARSHDASTGKNPTTGSNAPAKEAKNGVSSLIDYTPKVSHFAAELAGPAHLVERGFALRKTDKTQAAHLLEQAITALKSATPSRKNEDQVPLLAGLAYEGLAKEQHALDQYGAALRERPTNILARFRRGLIFGAQLRCDESAREMQEVEWYVPKLKSETLLVSGRCLLGTKRPDEAGRAFEQALALDPGSVPALREVVTHKLRILDTTTDPTQQQLLATQLLGNLTTLVEKDPTDRASSISLVRLLLNGPNRNPADTARLDQALSRARTLAESSQFSDDTAVRLLIQALVKKGDLAGAEAALAQGLSAHPASPELAAAKKQLEIEKSNPVTNAQADAEHS